MTATTLTARLRFSADVCTVIHYKTGAHRMLEAADEIERLRERVTELSAPDMFWDAEDPESCRDVYEIVDESSGTDPVFMREIQAARSCPNFYVVAEFRAEEYDSEDGDWHIKDYATEAEAEVALIASLPAVEWQNLSAKYYREAIDKRLSIAGRTEGMKKRLYPGRGHSQVNYSASTAARYAGYARAALTPKETADD